MVIAPSARSERSPLSSVLARLGRAVGIVLALTTAPFAVAHAASPVDPGLEAPGVEAAYRGWAEAQGTTGDATVLVCQPFVEPVHMCFARVEDGVRRRYTRADGRSAEELVAAARSGATRAADRLVAVTVDGFADPYWLASEGDGRDHAALLVPEALRKKVGGDFVVAAPSRGTLVVWKPGDIVFDKIVAVGVRRMYDTLPDPVSPLIFRWNGEKWAVWGEARAVDAPMGPEPTPSVPTPKR